MNPDPRPETTPRHPGFTPSQRPKATDFKQRIRPSATVVRPTLQGLRYEGSRLLRRALVILSLGFTLWQTQVITPDQIVGLLEEAVVPLVTTQTDPVADGWTEVSQPWRHGWRRWNRWHRQRLAKR